MPSKSTSSRGNGARYLEGRVSSPAIVPRTSDRISLGAAVEATQQMSRALGWWPDPASEDYLHDLLQRLAESPAADTPLNQLTGAVASRLLCQLLSCKSLTERSLGPRLDEAHRLRNALLLVFTADALRAIPAQWPLQTVTALPRRGHRGRPLTADETTLARATADLYDNHEHLKPAATYTLLDMGLHLCEATETRLGDTRKRGDAHVLRARGKWGWLPRDIYLDPWHTRMLTSIGDKMRSDGAGSASRMAYGGRAPREPKADASSSPVVRRLIEQAQLDPAIVLPRGIAITRARHTLETCRDWRGAAALVGLQPVDDIALGGIFGRLCKRCHIRQEDALDALRSGPVRFPLPTRTPPAVCPPQRRR